MTEQLNSLRQSCVVRVIFCLVALGFSGFYGWYAVTIFLTPDWKGGKKLLTYYSDRKNLKPEEQLHHGSWWFHQIFVNFVGSLVGWAAAYYLIFCRNARTSNPYIDAFLLLLALVGIFGYLPWRLFNAPLK